jgi:hypothetical protein
MIRHDGLLSHWRWLDNTFLNPAPASATDVAAARAAELYRVDQYVHGKSR